AAPGRPRAKGFGSHSSRSSELIRPVFETAPGWRWFRFGGTGLAALPALRQARARRAISRRRHAMRRAAPPALTMLFLRPLVASAAELVIATGDGKVALVEGVQKVLQPPRPDITTVLDISATPPRILGEVEVPTSLVGPGSSVAIAPNQKLAL